MRIFWVFTSKPWRMFTPLGEIVLGAVLVSTVAAMIGLALYFGPHLGGR